jgi:hypothetical protein
VPVNVAELACGFSITLNHVEFSGSSYHARVRPASTKSNAIPLESQREKRNDVGWKFMFWKQILRRQGIWNESGMRTLAFDAAAAYKKKAENGSNQPPATVKPEILSQPANNMR